MSHLSKSKIYFFYNDIKPSISDRTRLKHFIKYIFKNEKKKLTSLLYIFCSDSFLLKLNRQYLGHNYYTDILSFDLSEKTLFISAEIYISIDRVKENAVRLGIPFNIEIHRVIFHGALHLCGYDDDKKADLLIMRKRENLYLSKYFSNIQKI